MLLVEGAPAQAVGGVALFVKAVAPLAAVAVGTGDALGLGLEAARARKAVRAGVAGASSFHRAGSMPSDAGRGVVRPRLSVFDSRNEAELSESISVGPLGLDARSELPGVRPDKTECPGSRGTW